MVAGQDNPTTYELQITQTDRDYLSLWATEGVSSKTSPILRPSYSSESAENYEETVRWLSRSRGAHKEKLWVTVWNTLG
jgi:hypothetical protein